MLGIQIGGWVGAHQALVAGSVVALLDLVFAVKPNWAANGIVHWIWLRLKDLAGAGSPPSA